MDLKLPSKVNMVICALENSGFDAFAVGGCVRDMLMARKPKDFDITTNALPSEIKDVFSGYSVIETGIAHGTVTVLVENSPIEITTYRIDGEYEDMRRPKQVRFTRSLKEDLGRRDFTINAIAYNERTGLVDPFNGAKDIENRIIRCVGKADVRFNEDALRIMRAVRFMSELGFDAQKQTALSVIENRKLLKAISAERIYAELKKLLLGDNAERALSRFWCVIEEILPVSFPTSEADRAPKRVGAMPKELYIRLGALLYDVPQEARQALNALKAEKSTIKAVMSVLQFKDERAPKDTAEVKKLMRRMGADGFNGLCSLLIVEKGGEWERAKELYNEVIKSGECYNLSMLAVCGGDLLRAGVKEGADVGKTLNMLLDMVICGKVKNEKEELLNVIKRNGVDIDD